MKFICTRLKEYSVFAEKRIEMQRRSFESKVFIPKNAVEPFKINEITLVKAVPWVIEALNEINPLVIQKCFYKALKIDMFKVAGIDVNGVKDFFQIHRDI